MYWNDLRRRGEREFAVWMMSCNNNNSSDGYYDDRADYHHQHYDNNILPAVDPFNLRKLRPLLPTPPPPPSFSSFHHRPLAAADLNHRHLGNYNGVGEGEQGRRECRAQPVVVSSRWNPTPEQLRALEELYRCGTRTPSADQIQHITAQLRRYGKIEGKNVFYWFQNHKARERQKRRRHQMESVPAAAADDGSRHRDTEICSPKWKEFEGRRTNPEVEQTKNWALPANSSTLITAQESVPRERTAKAGGSVPEFRRQVGRNASWQMMQVSCPHLRVDTAKGAAAAIYPNLPTASQDLNVFTAPHYRGNVINGFAGCTHHLGDDDRRPDQTLRLFPLRTTGAGGDEDEDGEENVANDNEGGHYHHHNHRRRFFEFLPLKG